MNVMRALICVWILLVSGCVSNLSEDGGPCPCGPGWECCNVDYTCIREGEMCLTEIQNFLLSLQGTWIGTADEAPTASGSKRMEMEIFLQPGGEPSLGGLSGALRFGEDVEPPVVDPDDPGLDIYYENSLLDGYIFDILNPAIVNNRLLIEFKHVSQWVGFCEAQTVLYLTGQDAYSCAPPWPNDCDMDHNCIFENPEGGEVQMKESKINICFLLCICDEYSCTLRENEYSNQRLDLTVDIDNGIMHGIGSVGRIDAVRQ